MREISIDQVGKYTKLILKKLLTKKRKGFKIYEGNKIYETNILCKKCNRKMNRIAFSHAKFVDLLVCEKCKRNVEVNTGDIVISSIGDY